MIKKILYGCIGLGSIALVTFNINPNLFWDMEINKSCLKDGELRIKERYSKSISNVKVEYKGHAKKLRIFLYSEDYQNEDLVKEVLEESIRDVLFSCEGKNLSTDPSSGESKFYYWAIMRSKSGYESGGRMVKPTKSSKFLWTLPGGALRELKR